MTSVLIFIDSLTCGGAEKSLISLLPFLCERGYKISLMLRNRGGIFERYLPSGIQVFEFPFKPGRCSGLIYSAKIRIPRFIKRHTSEIYWECIGKHMPMLDDEFDVAIAYQQGFPTFYVAEKIKARKKICWVNTDLKAAGYSDKFCKPFYSKYDQIVAVSDTLRDSVIFPKYCKSKDRILTCWDILNESLIRKMANEKTQQERTAGKIDIVTVGRLVPSKGYDLAILAAMILKKRGLDFVWHFIGGGGLMAELHKMVAENGLSENIIIEGEKFNPYPYMAACDIYVQTSRFEGFGLTIAEAKILDKAIVSTDFPMVHHQIRNKQNGIIVETTPNGIADGIILLINNSNLKKSIECQLSQEHNTTAETESRKVISLIEQ